MGLCGKLFYEAGGIAETLLSRTSLNEEQLSGARKKKDSLLEYIKPELKEKLGYDVKHWIQGSYKNHTLIRPVRKHQEFDIDVGIYVFCNAAKDGIQASTVKESNRKALSQFCKSHDDSTLNKSKNSCERISYPKIFHIDIPVYSFDEKSEFCLLATQNDGWVDSDPQAFQSWFDNKVSHLNRNQLARLRRVIKYLKAWVALKWKEGEGRIPSIAINVLVARYYVDNHDDDDSFIDTVDQVFSYLIKNDVVPSPINGDDLLGFDAHQLNEARTKASALINSCRYIKTITDSFQQYVLWSATFEHLFPPFIERLKEITSTTNLPAITTPPQIRVRLLDKSGSQRTNAVTDRIKAFKKDKLVFSVDNIEAYGNGSEVHWMVRNQDSEAANLNDLGHLTRQLLSEECTENCEYSGTHYMECLVLTNGNISGISAVRVNITGLQRPPRNPPRKKYFKGR